jgi:hypothetical protein
VLKTKINAEPIAGSTSAHSHLDAIVECLIRHGNKPKFSFVWGGDKDGFKCRMSNPLDFELIERMFELPSSVHLLREKDLVYCERTWASIAGANA